MESWEGRQSIARVWPTTVYPPADRLPTGRSSGFKGHLEGMVSQLTEPSPANIYGDVP
jgi:hypothetical protein